jgi:type II secretory pathway pseudopilin PulG
MAHVRTYSGFTFIETLVAVAILTLFMLVSISVFSSLKNTQELKAAAQDVVVALGSARESTLRSASDTVYGVRIESARVVRFTGTSYASTSSSNVVFSFPNSVSATTSLSNATSTVLFTRLSGEASATGTITLTEFDSGATTSITIYRSGVVQ